MNAFDDDFDNTHTKYKSVVVCNEIVTPPTGQVRLISRPSYNAGRIEIYYANSTDWGTVCDRGFNLFDGDVVCRQLGFISANSTGNMFGPGAGHIWLADVNCTGTENSLAACQHSGWGMHNCNHNQDVSVICNDGTLVYFINNIFINSMLADVGHSISSNNVLFLY